ncbi:MAG: hypothetical protein ACRCS9_12560 [Hyphomicrobium sp.]
MFKKITNALMALVMTFGLAVSTAGTADARHGRGAGIAAGVAAGIIGLGILGATANARPRYYSRYDEGEYCYRGPRECHWAGRRCFENRWGDTVCRGGRYICERPLICE